MIGGKMAFALRDSVGNKYPIGTILRIGRDPANQIALQDQKASQFHCTLTENMGLLILQNETGSNETLVNQIPVQGQVQLNVGDRIDIGNTTFVVEVATEQIVESPPLVPVPQPPPSIQPPQGNLPSLVYQRPAITVPQQPSKKGGISPVFPLIFIILVSLACLIPVIGGYYYYKAPRAEKNKILNYFGKGPATIQIENFSDYSVYVFATDNIERTVGDDTASLFEWTVESFGIDEADNQDSGIYRLDFGSQAGDLDLGTCIFNLKGGEVYHFLVLPDTILIDRTEYPEMNQRDPTSVDELEINTSSLCKYTY